MEVDDIRQCYAELFEKGVRLMSEPREGVGHLFLEFQDPDSNILRLIQWVGKP